MADTLTDGYLQDFWNDLYKPISQNIVDFWAKQYKTYYQFYFGENDLEDSPDTPIIMQDLILSGNVFMKVPNNNTYFGGDSNGYGLLSTYLSIYPPYTNNPVLNQEILAYSDISYNYGSMSDWASSRPLSIEWIYDHYSMNPSYPDIVYSPQARNIWESLALSWDRYPDTYGAGSFSISNHTAEITLYDDGHFTDMYSPAFPVLSPRSYYPYSVGVGCIDMSMSNMYSNKPIVGYNQNTMYTYTYTTENGDTITTYYTDNSIINNTTNIPFSFNDYRGYMNDLLVEIGDNYPDFDTSIRVPTWEELDYIDGGDFYIEPLHQYDKIPVAPTFDGTIDLGDYPTVLAEGANTFLDFMPVTLSALFTAAFVACVVIRKLGR